MSVVVGLEWRLTAPMLDAADVLGILDRLDQAGLVVWLEGGWGVDALLGRHSRSHQDLDLVIARDDCDLAGAALAQAGFRHDPSAVPGLPARLVLADGGGRWADLHPVVFDRHGNGWQELGAGAWGEYPAEGLRGVGMVAGRPVRCLTPQLQVRHHLGYSLGATDRHDPGAAGRAVRRGGATGDPAGWFLRDALTGSVWVGLACAAGSRHWSVLPGRGCGAVDA